MELKEYNLEQYIVKYSQEKGLFALTGIPEDLELELIEQFVFFITYKNKPYKVNVHINNSKYMVLKDFDWKKPKK